MKDRKVTPLQASIFKLHAMLESSLKLQVTILAELTKQDKNVLFQAVWQEIHSNTRELINIQSHLSDDAEDF